MKILKNRANVYINELNILDNPLKEVPEWIKNLKSRGITIYT
jgi:hypothetical protein